jgi:hypothetical protein
MPDERRDGDMPDVERLQLGHERPGRRGAEDLETGRHVDRQLVGGGIARLESTVVKWARRGLAARPLPRSRTRLGELTIAPYARSGTSPP